MFIDTVANPPAASSADPSIVSPRLRAGRRAGSVGRAPDGAAADMAAAPAQFVVAPGQPLPLLMRGSQPTFVIDSETLQLVAANAAALALRANRHPVQLQRPAHETFTQSALCRLQGRPTAAEAAHDADHAGLIDGPLDSETVIWNGRLSHLVVVRQADIRQLDAGRALHERELQLSGIVETAMDAIISVDADQRIRVFNSAATVMFGISAAEAQGERLERFIPAPAHIAHGEHVANFARTGASVRRIGGLLHALTAVRANGEEFPIEASISKMGAGSTILMTAVIRDVTELKRAQEAHKAQLQAEATSRTKTAFLSRMSHELRTPLNAVLGFAQLLGHAGADPLTVRQRDQVDQIRRGGRHLLELINDVLDVAKIEEGRIDVRAESVSLASVVDEALDMLKERADLLQVSVHTRYRDACADTVTGDALRLRQVVLNLLSNAIKYNRPGGEVWVDLEQRDGRLVLTVADNGLGMSGLQLEHLFEPFNRLGRESSPVEGTGIGLFLTRQLVHLMGGEIVVDSSLGGTQARISLPSGVGGASARRPTSPEATASEDDPKPSGLVLYVEDNPVNYLLVEQVLQRWPDVRLLGAESVAEAIALASRVRPQITLLDMSLTDGTGLDVLRALRGSPATAELTIIGLSASAMAEDVAAALVAGADDYWIKPLDFDAFIPRMRALLSR
ncbi:MAG: PAS domain S-box protein [Methylibium sp.]|uniref:PAS domain-containing hybrid sensor histidine kinase/response regulator n=1 Tax=Methylibium sp. TaxID=2067992 RepID=UPI00179F5727|nr:ATP-binding protein [Methylibium sp.]MBA2723580.1 PAS domain S-box protein [Methylibium sp.]MBA3588327.1 PAS domain S-box protein [Methylibium sp.]